MIRVTALYPNSPGARFDHDYYQTVHLPLTEKLMRPHGLLWVEGDRPISPADGASSSLVAQTHAYFATVEQAKAAVRATMRELAADVLNYSSVTPKLEFHEVFKVQPSPSGDQE